MLLSLKNDMSSKHYRTINGQNQTSRAVVHLSPTKFPEKLPHQSTLNKVNSVPVLLEKVSMVSVFL